MPKVTATVSKTTNRVSLAQGNEYDLIGIETDCYRIIDESGEPTLFPKAYFLEDKVSPPVDWIYRKYEDEEYEYNMPQFSERGFFEDYADNVREAVEAIIEYKEKSNGSNLFSGRDKQ